MSVFGAHVPRRKQSYPCPRRYRLLLISFITFGILIAYLINFGTKSIQSPASWRILMGIGFVFAFILGFGILLFPETPRFDYR